MTRFWITPGAAVIHADHHWKEAVKSKPKLAPAEACELLMKNGHLRCVIDCDQIFFERRVRPTERQMSALLDIAIEKGIRLYDDGGNLVYDPIVTGAI